VVRRFTGNAVGGTSGPFGGTNVPTALGCFHAIREAAAHVYGPDSLAGRTAAVQGLGGVGLEVAALLAGAGVKLTAADVDEAAVRRAQQRLESVVIVPPDGILSTPCDLFVPCALGGILDEAAIDRLRCKLVYGPPTTSSPRHRRPTRSDLPGGWRRVISSFRSSGPTTQVE